MPQVTIYTTGWCPYCHAAKALLTEKGVAFEEIGVDGKPELRLEMTAKAAGAPPCRRSSSAGTMSAAPTICTRSMPAASSIHC